MNVKKIIIFVLSCLIIFTSLFYFIKNRGVTVKIHNVDSISLQSVVIFVTGRTYPLGDIPSGNTTIIKVNPKGESHIEIEQGEIGKRKRFVVDCYFESGYKGEILIDIDSEKTINIEDKIKVGINLI